MKRNKDKRKNRVKELEQTVGELHRLNGKLRLNANQLLQQAETMYARQSKRLKAWKELARKYRDA